MYQTAVGGIGVLILAVKTGNYAYDKAQLEKIRLSPSDPEFSNKFSQLMHNLGDLKMRQVTKRQLIGFGALVVVGLAATAESVYSMIYDYEAHQDLDRWKATPADRIYQLQNEYVDILRQQKAITDRQLAIFGVVKK